MKKPYQIEAQRAVKQLAEIAADGNPSVQNLVAATVGRRADPFRGAWMNRLPLRCQSAVRIVAAEWSRKAAKHSIKKRLSAEPWCAVSISL